MDFDRDAAAPERVHRDHEGPQYLHNDSESPEPYKDFVHPTLQPTIAVPDGKYEHSDEAHSKNKRIGGLRPVTFWLLILSLGLIIVGGSVGGAVGGTRASKTSTV